MRHLIIAICLAALASACSHNVQTSSGEQYLKRYPDSLSAGAHEGSGASVTDSAVRRASAVEPTLALPARFGLARIVNGNLTNIPQEEAALWMEFAQKHPSYGEFVPISPIIASFAESAVVNHGRRSREYRKTVGDIVSTIRLGAARQHVDAVLIYEISASSDYGRTIFAFTDFTIIGMSLFPNRNVEAHGVANALLLDVRNGYPYGSATAEADLSSLSTTLGVDETRDELQAKASLEVVTNLVPEVETMVGQLALALATKSSSQASTNN